MMMPKEGMVCFILFLDNKNGLVKKTSLYLNYWEIHDPSVLFNAWLHH